MVWSFIHAGSQLLLLTFKNYTQSNTCVCVCVCFSCSHAQTARKLNIPFYACKLIFLLGFLIFLCVVCVCASTPHPMRREIVALALLSEVSYASETHNRERDKR